MVVTGVAVGGLVTVINSDPGVVNGVADMAVFAPCTMPELDVLAAFDLRGVERIFRSSGWTIWRSLKDNSMRFEPPISRRNNQANDWF